ncbi:hypothetical protein BCV71DRAFT_286213 [Rhizopus microsporus]|uniref:Uncharacterized protein n=1 Tax=Rhizopus microsporus TaxID=58291 RepID=A0A1X0S1A9_RHIZD|nr:hypothetical protein BCV71DRAFT_286213 [Rhizopus microsporus]
MPFFKTSILFFSKLTVDLDQPHGYKSLKRSSKVGWTNRIYRLHQLSLFTHLFHRFHVATDTSATVIVGILYQIINVAMIPRKVSPLERNYSTTKRPIHSKNFRDLVTSACTNTIEGKHSRYSSLSVHGTNQILIGTGNGIKMHVPYSHRTERSMPWKLVEFIWRRKHSGNYWER